MAEPQRVYVVTKEDDSGRIEGTRVHLHTTLEGAKRKMTKLAEFIYQLDPKVKTKIKAITLDPFKSDCVEYAYGRFVCVEIQEIEE